MDPLSIASASVGILSFGLTVCHGLLEYYNTWKDAEGNVAKMYLAIQGLTKTLVLIKSAVEHKEFNRNIVLQIEESIRSTEAGIASLKKKLDKIRISSPQDGWREKSKAQFGRALFPFKESTLVKLKEVSNELRDNLSLALNVLQINASATSLSKLEIIGQQMGSVFDGVDYLKAHAATTSSSLEDMKKSLDETSGGVDALVLVNNEDYISKVYEWLSPLTEEFQRKQLSTYNFRSRQDGAGNWLLATDEFNDWFCGKRKMLWCQGIPGGGKTVLTSFVVNHLQQTVSRADIGIAYIYCDYKAKEKQTLENLIASLLHQLLLHRPLYHDRLVSLYQSHSSNRGRPSISDYARLLQSSVQSYDKVYFIIDALDECSEANGTRKDLLAEVQKLKPAVNTMITSRDIPSIERLLQDAARVEVQAHDEDMKNYVEDRISSSERIASYVKKSPDLQDRILKNVSEKASGMFLLARLHLDSLSTKTTLRKFKTALESLSDDLNVTYDEIWERIKAQNPDDADLAKKVVYWVFHAMRPLTVPELQHALAVEPEDPSLDGDSIPDEDLMVSVCAGIVAVQRESNTVGLVHATTQEYFDRKATSYFPEAQREILRTCLTYLSFQEFERGPCNSDKEVETRLQERPLLQYASGHWGRHVNERLEESEETLILGFLGQGSKMATSLQILHLKPYKLERYTPHYTSDPSALWLAAYFGLSRIAKLLLEQGVEDDGNDEFGIKPFELAASRGHENMVRLLLGFRADREVNTAFHHAAWSGHEAVMRLLLEHGADINAANAIGMTALHLASRMGYQQLTRFLFEKGANIALTTSHNPRTLYLAARSGNSAVIQVLLEHGGDYLYEAEAYMGALCVAYRNHHTPTVDILLKHMDKALAIDRQGRNPLHLASAKEHVGLVHRMLEKGLNPRDLDKQKRTSLHHAAAGGSSEVVERLLEEGVDPAQTDVDHWTPLHWAARAGKESNIKILVNANGDSVPGMMFRWEPQSLRISPGQVSHIQILTRIYDVLITCGSLSKLVDNPNHSQPLSLFTSVIVLKMKQKLFDSFKHLNVQCDGCQLSIMGIRHKCVDCDDFDFCSKCILSSKATHHRHHTFHPSAPANFSWEGFPGGGSIATDTAAIATTTDTSSTPDRISQEGMTTTTTTTIPKQFFNPAEPWTARDEQNYVAQSILLALFPELRFG